MSQCLRKYYIVNNDKIHDCTDHLLVQVVLINDVGEDDDIDDTDEGDDNSHPHPPLAPHPHHHHQLRHHKHHHKHHKHKFIITIFIIMPH